MSTMTGSEDTGARKQAKRGSAPPVDPQVKIKELHELFADAPDLGKKALDNVLRELTSQVAELPPPIESAGRVGARLGKISELTIVVPLAVGGAKRLRSFLRLLGGNLSPGASKVGTLHDMRFVFLDNDTKLLFATSFDGDWDTYIDDFVTKIPDYLDIIDSAWDGWPGIRSPGAKDYLVKHQITAEGWFVAHPDLTVAETDRLVRLGKAVDEFLDTIGDEGGAPEAQPAEKKPTTPEQARIVEQKIQKLRQLYSDAPEMGRAALEKGLPNLTREIAAAAGTQSAGRIGARQGKVSELTAVAPFAPGGAKRLRGLLQALEGNFRGGDAVGTLHDMRFVFLDNDSKLLFATAYDGEWDAYIDDFVTKIPDALDLLFCNIEGWPGIHSPTVKDWLVAHQIPADAWYVSSPKLTVAETRRLEHVGQAVEQFLDRIG